MTKALSVLSTIDASVRWLSIEPLSFDILPVLEMNSWDEYVDWIVIGAASNNKTIYFPDSHHFTTLVAQANWFGIPIFYKGNLKGMPEADVWRNEFPHPATRRFTDEWFMHTGE
jgi:hypothetical protein